MRTPSIARAAADSEPKAVHKQMLANLPNRCDAGRAQPAQVLYAYKPNATRRCVDKE